MTAPAGWARVAALVDHYWQNIPQEELHQMSNLLESSPAGLVVVAVDKTNEDIELLLSGAIATIINDSAAADLDVNFTKAIDAADEPQSPRGAARDDMDN